MSFPLKDTVASEEDLPHWIKKPGKIKYVTLDVSKLVDSYDENTTYHPKDHLLFFMRFHGLWNPMGEHIWEQYPANRMERAIKAMAPILNCKARMN